MLKVPKIFALDPTGPHTNLTSLNFDDARDVIAIHTDAWFKGKQDFSEALNNFECLRNF